MAKTATLCGAALSCVRYLRVRQSVHLAVLGAVLVWWPAKAETGLASWYKHGRLRADGVRFNPRDPHICAHKTLPLGQRIRVTVIRTGRSLTCVVRDRGPYKRGRIVDVTEAGAEQLGIIRSGTARVKVEPALRK